MEQRVTQQQIDNILRKANAVMNMFEDFMKDNQMLNPQRANMLRIKIEGKYNMIVQYYDEIKELLNKNN